MYWRGVERGLHLGYRRLKGRNGTWWARHYLGEQRYETEALGIADDLSDPDGLVVLSFDQAMAKARQRMVERAGQAVGIAPTVREAVEEYIASRDRRESSRKGRPVRSDAATRLSRYVLAAEVADIELDKLDEDALAKWRAGLPALKASTVQRTTNDFRAALNAACRKRRKQLGADFPATVKNGLRAPDNEDDDAEPVARENQILTGAQIASLLAAAREIDAEQDWGGDLFRLAVVLAATGARFSQIARLRVADVQREKSRLIVPPSRKGRGTQEKASIPVPVGADVLDVLLPVVTGREGSEPLLERWRHVRVIEEGVIRWQRGSRGPWSSSAELTRPWAEIRKRAGMSAVIPYSLRHSSIVRGIRANLPIRLVAALHDTSTAMIERHYGRWVADGLDELAARAVVPLLPAADDAVVVPLRKA